MVDHREAWNVGEQKKLKSGIELEGSHIASYLSTYTWSGKDFQDHGTWLFKLVTGVPSGSEHSLTLPFTLVCFIDWVLLARIVWMKYSSTKTT